MRAKQSESLSEDRLAVTRSERIAEYKKRKKPYDYAKVRPTDVEDFKSQGWEFDRELKTGIRLRRSKSGDEILENRFWSVLYLLGFGRLNSGRHFRLTVTIDGKGATKQIDVLGIDENTVVVAECKSAETLKKELAICTLRPGFSQETRCERCAQLAWGQERPQVHLVHGDSANSLVRERRYPCRGKANSYSSRTRASLFFRNSQNAWENSEVSIRS